MVKSKNKLFYKIKLSFHVQNGNIFDNNYCCLAIYLFTLNNFQFLLLFVYINLIKNAYFNTLPDIIEKHKTFLTVSWTDLKNTYYIYR